MTNPIFNDQAPRLRSKELLVIHNNSEGMISQGGSYGQNMLHAWERSAYKIFVTKPEGKRPLGKLRRKCVDNIIMDLGEIGWGGMDWIYLAQEGDQWRALVYTVRNLQAS
jgi:hypothetical protein